AIHLGKREPGQIDFHSGPTKYFRTPPLNTSAVAQPREQIPLAAIKGTPFLQGHHYPNRPSRTGEVSLKLAF
ncbi:MAG: hypothetical protein ACI9UQ_002365, partial [Candidatus Krumholzibacteriia bacterium]